MIVHQNTTLEMTPEEAIEFASKLLDNARLVLQSKMTGAYSRFTVAGTNADLNQIVPLHVRIGKD